MKSIESLSPKCPAMKLPGLYLFDKNGYYFIALIVGVTASGNGTGTIIYARTSDSLYSVGKYSEHWSIGEFSPYTGSITLSND